MASTSHSDSRNVFDIVDVKSTPSAILLSTDSDLRQSSSKLSLLQCRKLKRETAKLVNPPRLFMPAIEIVPSLRLTTGCEKLDKALQGGIPSQGITEISGESACGKTQLCLQLSLTAQWPKVCGGQESGVLYICTEDVFPSRRLQQLIKSFRSPSSNLGTDFDYGANIYVEHVPDVESLWSCVCHRAPALMLNKPIGLIVIDSVAGVFRTHLEDGIAARANAFRALVKQLMKISQQFNTVIVCVNQVAEIPDEMCDSGSREVPALGLSWANLVHTRLRLSRDASGARFIEALSSSEIPSDIKWPYSITQTGIHGT